MLAKIRCGQFSQRSSLSCLPAQRHRILRFLRRTNHDGHANRPARRHSDDDQRHLDQSANSVRAASARPALPITLRAQTPGQVILNGNSKINISGNWLVVDGLKFRRRRAGGRRSHRRVSRHAGRSHELAAHQFGDHRITTRRASTRAISGSRCTASTIASITTISRTKPFRRDGRRVAARFRARQSPDRRQLLSPTGRCP